MNVSDTIRLLLLKPITLVVVHSSSQLHITEYSQQMERNNLCQSDCFYVKKKWKEKKIFLNVDFNSGLVYSCLEFVDSAFFMAKFAATRSAAWTSHMPEYMENNRIFRSGGIMWGNSTKPMYLLKNFSGRLPNSDDGKIIYHMVLLK